MSFITLRTSVQGIECTGGGYNSVDIEIDGLDTDDVLKEIELKDVIEYHGTDLIREVDIQEIIEYKGADDLLDAIGEEAARKYFGIEDAE